MGYHFSSRLTATLNLCLIYFKITWALAILLAHMRKKFEINWIKIKGSCQSGIIAVTHDSKRDLPLSAHISKIILKNQIMYYIPSITLCSALSIAMASNLSNCFFSFLDKWDLTFLAVCSSSFSAFSFVVSFSFDVKVPVPQGL